MTTPIRRALLPNSSLRRDVRDGLEAIEKKHRSLLGADIRVCFADSLEIDESLRRGNDQANRWDYLLGHSESEAVVGLEPHSASTSEVSTVIGKKKAALRQLASHLKPGARVVSWFWVASGRVDFVPHERVVRRLDQAGITFVGETLKKKHLPKRRVT